MNLEAIFAALRRHMEMKKRMEEIHGQHPQMGQRPTTPPLYNQFNGQMPQRQQMMAPPYNGIMSGQLNRRPQQMQPMPHQQRYPSILGTRG